MNGSLILGWIVIGGTFGWNSLQGETFSMACLQAKAMVKLHPIAIVAPKPIMAWVTASTERDCQKKRFYSENSYIITEANVNQGKQYCLLVETDKHVKIVNKLYNYNIFPISFSILIIVVWLLNKL